MLDNNSERKLQEMMAKGGPDPVDYSALDLIFKIALRSHSESKDEQLNQLRATLSKSLTNSTMQGFALRKPHGYAGDFEIIDRIYQEYTSDDPHLTKWDLYWQQHAAARAVRNRKTYFHHLLQKLASFENASVLKIAVGPGRSMFEFLSDNPSNHIQFDCVDICPKSINFASTLNARFADQITFHTKNALRFNSQKTFGLVWSAGLFDYLNDKVFISLLKRLYSLTSTGGELVVGNFSPDNPSKYYMEFFDWNLIHRSSSDLETLAKSAGIPESQISIGKEPEGVNLFLHVKK